MFRKTISCILQEIMAWFRLMTKIEFVNNLSNDFNSWDYRYIFWSKSHLGLNLEFCQ